MIKKSLVLPALCLWFAVFAQSYLPPAYNIFMQGNNINTTFRTDGIFNYDWVTFQSLDAGFIWPVTAPIRMTADFATGIWIAAKVGPQSQLRASSCSYSSLFSPGNIPVIGQVPPQSVCNDPSWRGYLVQLNDPSLTNGGVRTKLAGGRQYTFNYDSWANWPVQKGAPYVEVNNIPGYQPGWNSDRPGIGNGSRARPDDLLFMVYMDYTNCTNDTHYSQIGLLGGTLPLGVEIQQLSFMFNCIPLQNAYFIKWKIINKSLLNWDSTYIAIYNDVDIGADACGASDDAQGCDTLRNLAFSYNGDNNDCNYSVNPPSIGSRFLQGPLKFTGNNSDTAKLPYDTLIGYKLLGMSSYLFFEHTPIDPCMNDPDNASAGYNFMKGFDACGRPIINPLNNMPTKFMYPGDACNRVGWYDSLVHDVRHLQTTGFFSMGSSDTQIVVMSFVITRDGGNNYQNVCALQSYSDSALKYYYNDFRTCTPIGIQPISNEVPARFELLQNYPNPFNPTTNFEFRIAEFGLAKLIIYDILGREVATLVNEELRPGSYKADWDASSYPSGIYFYTLTAGSFTDTKKMVLIK